MREMEHAWQHRSQASSFIHAMEMTGVDECFVRPYTKMCVFYTCMFEMKVLKTLAVGKMPSSCLRV